MAAYPRPELSIDEKLVQLADRVDFLEGEIERVLNLLDDQTERIDAIRAGCYATIEGFEEEYD